MTKPSSAAIRRSPTLSETRRGADPIRVCSICGTDVDPKDLPCTRHGRYVPVRHALDCAGQRLPGEETTK